MNNSEANKSIPKNREKAEKSGGALSKLGGVETLFKEGADIAIANAEKAYLTTGVSGNDDMQQVISFRASLLQSLGADIEATTKTADMAIFNSGRVAKVFLVRQGVI